MICRPRDKDKVCDLLELKLKYCKEAEKDAKARYKRLKSEMKETCKTKTETRRLNRMVQRVARATTHKWEKGCNKIRRRVEWLSNKFKLPKIRKETKEETEEEWIRRLAQG